MRTKICYRKDLYIPDWLEKEVDGNPLLASILLQRGINTPEKVKEFLDPHFYQRTDFTSFPEIEETVVLILETIKKGKKICIYGDYDVDGVTATVILVELIKILGGEVIYHLPDRFSEGYGLNKKVVKKLADQVGLIITCDCGISNYEEVKLARELGLKVIITDHHNLPDKLPPADFILSPKLLASTHQAYNIPGAGMAYFLALAVLAKVGREDEKRSFLELLSLAIVADVVPLSGENRYLLQIGLPLLASTRRTGLRELYKIAGINNLDNITEEEIAFRLAPLINSAGRILKADLAVELLLTEDQARGEKLALELDTANKERKELQEQVIREVRELLSEDPQGRPIVLYQPYWHAGVIGIAAGRLSEDYQVPVLLMCQKDGGKIITGSARSIPGVHIYQHLKLCDRYLSRYGGHAGAAGFSLEPEQLTIFSKQIGKILIEKMEKKKERMINVDGELSLDKVSLEDYYSLRRLAPFGEGNPLPRFVAYSTEIIYKRPTTGNRHLRLLLTQNGVQYPGIWWWAGEKEISPVVDLVYTPGINDFQGKRELQLLVEEMLTISEDSVSLKVEEKGVTYKSKRASFEIIDLRNWKDKGRKLPFYNDAVYYYEGLKILKEKEIINRYQFVNNKTLVLLSCPPSLAVFKEIIYANRPSRLVLAYNRTDLDDGRKFIKKLSGLIKYLVNNHGGQLDLYQLAAKTGEMERTVIAGLQYLKAKGFITLNSFNPRFYIVRINTYNQGGNWKMKEKELLALIRETISFKLYFLKVQANKISELF